MYKISTNIDPKYENLTIEKENTKISMFITIDANQSQIDPNLVFYYPNNQIKLKNMTITPESPSEYLHFFRLNIDKYEKLKKSVKFIIAINPSMCTFNTAIGNLMNIKYNKYQKKVIIAGLDLIKFKNINDDNLRAIKIYLVEDTTNLRNLFIQMKFIINEESVIKKLEYLEIIKKTFLLKELVLDLDSLESRVQFIHRIEETEYESLLKIPGTSKTMPGSVNIILLNLKNQENQENHEINDSIELNLKNYSFYQEYDEPQGKKIDPEIENNGNGFSEKMLNEKNSEDNLNILENNLQIEKKDNLNNFNKEDLKKTNQIAFKEFSNDGNIISENITNNNFNKSLEIPKIHKEEFNNDFCSNFITFITYHIPRTDKYNKKELSILQNIIKLAKKGNLENIIKEEKVYKNYDEEYPEFCNNCYLYYNCSINFGLIKNRESSFYSGLYNFNKNSSGTIIYDFNFMPIGISFLGSYDLDLLKYNKISENILIPFSHPGILHILANYLNIPGYDLEIFLKSIKTPFYGNIQNNSRINLKNETKSQEKKNSKKKEKLITVKKKTILTNK